MITSPSRCRSCGAPVVWALTQRGKRIPLDAAPIELGNIRLDKGPDGEPLAVYVQPGSGDWVSHFVTCPEAKSWRRR